MEKYFLRLLSPNGSSISPNYTVSTTPVFGIHDESISQPSHKAVDSILEMGEQAIYN